jgi:TonB family protein
MDNIVEYLIKSGIALSVFYLFYWLFMRRSTHFGLNRITLAASLLASLVLPLFEIDLTPEAVASNIPVMSIDLTNVVQVISKPETNWGIREIVLFIYFTGLVITLFRLIYQSIYIHVIARMSRTITKGNHTIVLVEKDITPFAYFSKIFIPASKMEETSFESILAHEKSHLSQYHYIDLFLIELVTIVQWFNPVVWLYERSVKEVHEFLADEEVLKQGTSKGNYQALLVNQALGGPVFTISHQFNQSLILKRIVMMTKMKSSRVTKVKALFFIPLVAALLVAFSNPEPLVGPVADKVENIRQQIADTKLLPDNLFIHNSLTPEQGSITIKGNVIDESTSKPLESVSIMVKGTTTGTVSDVNGAFEIKAEGPKPELIFSCIGYKTIVKEFTSGTKVVIHMTKSATEINEVVVSYPGDKQLAEIKPYPYVLIDGVPSDEKALKLLDPDRIESVNVLKDEQATSKYGDKGKDGVILVTTKKGNTNETKVTANQQPDNSRIFTVVEQMPQFPGGDSELNKFLSVNLKAPSDAMASGLQGTVISTFIVEEDGSVANAKIIRGIGKSYDEEVLRVINLMPRWIPGKQNGKAVAVQFTMPVKFAKQ